MPVEVMVSAPAALDFNRLVDFVIPAYSALVVVVVISFLRTRQRDGSKRIYNFVRKEAEDESAPKRIYKLEDYLGIWQQVSALRIDEWFAWTRKNLAIRLLAPTQFFKIRQKFELHPDGRLSMKRDMGPGTPELIFASMVVVKNIEEGDWVSTQQANPMERTRARAAFDEATGTFYMQIEDAAQEGKYRGCFLYTRNIDQKDPNKMTTVRYCAKDACARCVIYFSQNSVSHFVAPSYIFFILQIWTGKYVDPTLTEKGGPMTVFSERVLD